MGIGIILDFIIIGMLILSIWLGYKKGLTKSLLKIFSFLIAIVISLILYKPIANLVITQTDIVNNLQNTIVNKFKDEEEKNNKLKSYNSENNEIENKNNEESIEKEEIETYEKQEEVTEKNFKNIFNKYIEEKIIESANEAKEYVIEKASKEIAIFIVNICVYIFLLIAIRIILIFIKALAELITKIPGIKQCDELLGGIYGCLRALIIILAIVTVLSIIISITSSDWLIEIINQTFITKFIYENNIIIKIIL